MVLWTQWFGQDVSSVFLRSDMCNLHNFSCHCFSNFVVCDSIMFLLERTRREISVLDNGFSLSTNKIDG
jgi:hypothetical protein